MQCLNVFPFTSLANSKRENGFIDVVLVFGDNIVYNCCILAVHGDLENWNFCCANFDGKLMSLNGPVCGQ